MNILKQPSNNYQKRWVVAVMEQEDLTPATKLVAMFLREIWWNDVGTPDEPTDNAIYASYEQIKRATNLSNHSIARAINQLEDAGFLHQTSRSKKQGTANRYYPVRIDKVIESIADDYLNLDLSGFAENLSGFDEDLSGFDEDLSVEQSVNSKEIRNTNSSLNNEEKKEEENISAEVFSLLDYETSSSLDSETARFEHREVDDLWSHIQTSTDHIDRAVARKDFINAKKRSWGVA